MKNLCKAVLAVFFFAFLVNAQESPTPLSSDGSLKVDSATVSETDTLKLDYDRKKFREAMEAEIEKQKEAEGKKVEEKNVEEKKIAKKCGEYNPEDYQKNLRMTAYLHPLSFFYGAAYNMLMFTSTIEKPLNLSKSVIIQPTVWLGSSDGYIGDIVEYEKLTRLGGGIGIRQYAVNKGQGFYLQAIASAYYISANGISHKEGDGDEDYGRYPRDKITTWANVKSVLGELMLYVGSAHKWQNLNFFFEGGFGLGYDGTDTFKMGYINKLAANFNLGLGIPF